MRGYDREELNQTMEDEYDDYEDSGYGQEEEEEEEEYEEEVEPPKPTKEEMDFLEYRQRVKDRLRKQRIKEGGGSALNNSSDRKKKLPYDNFGSFFGPSQPVIAQRVIQESKSLLENRHLTPQVSNALHPNKKSSSSSTPGSKPGVQGQKAKVVNEHKTRVQKLKDTRDYSFLLSDDAELPAPAKVPPQRNAPVPNPDARPAQVPMKSKQALGNNGRHANGGHVERKSVPMNGRPHSKVGSNKLPSASRPSSAPMDSRRQHSSSNGTGPGRPLVTKSLPSKMPAPVEKKVSTSAAKSSIQSSQKPLPSKSQSSVSRQQMGQKRELRAPIKPKILPKQPAGLSKPQINKPQKRTSSHLTSQDNRPKKKPVRRYSDDEIDDIDHQDISSMIRGIFNYNPNKFADRDDDLSDMEANFEDIMREEQRSAFIARKEDEEQLRLIEEEERRERLAKMRKAKKAKGR